MNNKKLKQKDFLEILKTNSKENPFDISNYDKQSILDCKMLKGFKTKPFYVEFTCKNCNNKITKNINKISKINFKYITYCANCIRITTTNKLYKCNNVFQNKEIKNKIKKSNLEKYGTEYASQSNKIKEKMKKTNLSKYGVSNPSQSTIVKEKRRETILKKYGKDHYSKTKEYKKKYRKTCLNRYGVDNPNKLEEIKNKKRKTSSKHFGVDNPNKSNKVRRKTERTCLNKYKNKTYLNSEDYKTKSKKKYGKEFPSQSEEIKNKIKKSNLEKYGVEHYNNPDKQKKTCLSKYGVKCYTQSEEWKQYMLDNYGSLNVNYKYKFDNIYFDSSWELAFYIYHIDKNHNIIRVKKSFTYNYKNIEYNYIPDFKVGNKYYEIKGEQFIKRDKNGNIKTLINPFDSKQNNKYKAKYKCILEHKIIIIDFKKIKKYLKYVENNYGYDYLNKFIIKKKDNDEED